MDIIETSFLALLISIVVIPFIAFVLNLFIPFNYTLIFIALFIPLVISLFLIKKIKINWTISKSSILILFLFLISFFLRIQTLSSYYMESDPYYYGIGDRGVIQNGFPEQKNYPEVLYLTSTWYYLMEGSEYNNLNSMYIRNLYPPLLGALIVFIGFFLFKELYGSWIGLSASVVFAFIPQLLQIFHAGVSEEFPWGVAFCFFSVVFLYFATLHRNKKMYLIFLIMLLAALLGSKAKFVPLFISIIYLVLCSIKDFILKEENKVYYEISFGILSTMIIVNLLLLMYWEGLFFLNELLFSLIGFIITYFLYKVKVENRVKFLGVLAIIGIIFTLTIGFPLLEYGINLVNYGGGDNPMLKVYAEENFNNNGENLSKYFGTIGLSFTTIVDSPLKIFKKEFVNIISIPLIYVMFIFIFIWGFFKENKNYLLLFLIFIMSISSVALIKMKMFPYLSILLTVALVSVIGEFKNIKNRDYIFVMLIMLGVMLFYSYLIYLYGTVSYFTNTGELSSFYVNSHLLYAIFILILGVLTYYSYIFYKKKEIEKVGALIILIFILPLALKYAEIVPYSMEYMFVNGTNYEEVYNFCEKIPNKFSVPGGFYCNILSKYEYDAFEYIKTIEDDKVLILSDFVYQTKFFTNKENIYSNYIIERAYLFTNEDESLMWDFMEENDINYVIFTRDFLAKWWAITYLSCYHEGKIEINEKPGENECYNENLFEFDYTPHDKIDRCEEGNTYGIKYCILYEGILLDEQLNEEDIRITEKTYYINGTYFIMNIKKNNRKAFNSVLYRGLIKGELNGFEKVYIKEETSSIAIHKRINKKDI